MSLLVLSFPEVLDDMLVPTSLKKTLIRPLSRLSAIGLVSALGVLSGWVPGFSSHQSLMVFDAPSYAQSAISNDDIVRYARTVLDMEPLRQASYQSVKRQMNGVPGNVCRQGNVSASVKGVCNRFLNQSAQIIKKHGLSTEEYNAITRRLGSDKGLRNRIQKELIRQQNRR